MQIEDVLKLITRLIEKGERHADYDYTVKLADTYKTFITGEGIDKKLIQYVQREDAALFAQRIRITKSTTPAVAASIRQPFNKVVRNDRVRKDIKLNNDNKKKIVEKMADLFYGNSRTKNKGLDYWLTTRFLEMQFIDPNSWAVIEWDAPESAATTVKPRPFEVSAKQAVNFFIDNDAVKWLFVEQAIKFNDVQTAGGEPIQKDGCRFTMYEETFTVVFEQVSKGYLQSIGYTLAGNETFTDVKEKTYLVRINEPKIGYVPAFRVGYKRDELTNGRTYVNPWHDSLCYFEKSLKTVSELDLTMTQHVFPQKLQYVQKCGGSPGNEGTPARKCNNGYYQGTQLVCGACQGRGYKLHTTAQDALLIPLPTDPKREDILPLEDLIAYKTPPIDLIKFQNEYALQLESQAHQGVFNSQVFARKVGGEIQTATAENINYESVYDTLEPFTEKYSELWREFITVFSIITGETLENIDITHEFPADYKLKTIAALMAERKTAKESNAPAFMVETIDDDIAGILYTGDRLAMEKHRIKRRYFPFSGKNEDEVQLLLASEFVPEESKILYCNFETIFREIEREMPNFWTTPNRKEQDDKVAAKVAEWKLKLTPPAPVLGNFKVDTGGELVTDDEPKE